MRILRFRFAPLLVLLAVAIAASGCVTRSAPAPLDAGAPAAEVAVDRLFRGAQTNNFREMSAVFGTKDGSISTMDPPSVVERRMYALAVILKHDTFQVRPGGPVPGRGGEAMQFTVALKNGQRSYDVPVIAVQGKDRRWFVEQIAVEAVTNARSS